MSGSSIIVNTALWVWNPYLVSFSSSTPTELRSFPVGLILTAGITPMSFSSTDGSCSSCTTIATGILQTCVSVVIHAGLLVLT
ncbi:hypothetical protein SADUNF_Sadunf08G0009600 [Salix dunnii]|uniref:Uncharacterized protein n=1 Tax=Salix dunnii TaxID=1413687 RepID=A0A835JUN0_9ROSI|nr:hypothetical protein SADUNF_Sadunf08G0009600 [Salix dunnii]